eukprot:m.48329 g.48329  ORF g.48329 m.48329 type:complete len:277 (+) comp10563_c0_seq1:87-917(+)
MKNILVSGANKGVGLALVKEILKKPDTFVFLGSRNAERGQVALKEVIEAVPDCDKRVSVVEVDVADQGSVEKVAKQVSETVGKLYALVNNAGQWSEHKPTIRTNCLGIKYMTDAFLPLIIEGGRIVNVTSASGPMFVAKCNQETQKYFLQTDAQIPEVAADIEKVLEESEDSITARMGHYDQYGLSKAFANLLTVSYARENPTVKINACTPGFLATDLVINRFGPQSSAKPPIHGTVSPLKLLFEDLPGNGRYYGSDGLRSPLDKYRGPGDPEYSP